VEIYEAPADSFVASFIGETNYLEGRIVEMLDKETAIAEIEGIGKITVFLDKPVKVSDTIKLTVRPEKIHITSEKPPQSSAALNIFDGIVDEIIYTGFQSKYFIKLGEKFTFKVFKQHVKYFTDEKSVSWKDHVYVWWNAKDGFIVEVNPS
ncbi:MAG TPA: TOBE domain-containing protein, partial [Chitinispirillaceae bacterium]|nr:TOBE domain-containing protein [Chitinispirillaceae bacterium]